MAQEYVVKFKIVVHVTATVYLLKNVDQLNAQIINGLFRNFVVDGYQDAFQVRAKAWHDVVRVYLFRRRFDIIGVLEDVSDRSVKIDGAEIFFTFPVVFKPNEETVVHDSGQLLWQTGAWLVRAFIDFFINHLNGLNLFH